jgi:hypothetical protein
VHACFVSDLSCTRPCLLQPIVQDKGCLHDDILWTLLCCLDKLAIKHAQSCALQITQGRSNVHQLCDALGIADSQHLPKSFRSLLPCAAALPGVVDLAPDIVKYHRVDRALWAALGPFVMRLARNEVTAAAVQAEPAFAVAKRQWIGTSGATNATLKREAEAAERSVQVRDCLASTLSVLTP